MPDSTATNHQSPHPSNNRHPRAPLPQSVYRHDVDAPRCRFSPHRSSTMVPHCLARMACPSHRNRADPRRIRFRKYPCRGAVEEIVTDNCAALDWLANRNGIRHICISAYNSRANGIVERQHRTIRESIVKACEGRVANCSPSRILGRPRDDSQIHRPHPLLHGSWPRTHPPFQVRYHSCHLPRPRHR